MKNQLLKLHLAFAGLFTSVAYAAEQTGQSMMSDGGMMMSGPMMLVCMLFGLLILVALVLAILSLIKYLRK